MTISHYLLRFSLFSFLTLILSACDGGIFGTGDGGPILVDSTDAIESSGDIANTPNVDAQTEATEIAFINLQSGTNTALPLINIINVSDQAINAILNDSSNALFQTPIAAGAFSDTATLALGENKLLVIHAETAEELISMQPLTVSESTLTTLIVKNITTQGLNLVPLSSLSISQTPSVAQLRIIQADLLSDADISSTFSLQPTGLSPGSSEVNFPDISVASAATARYQLITPGDYLLLDALGRMESQLLTMQAGKIYTLIILNRSNAPYLLHEDDLLAR